MPYEMKITASDASDFAMKLAGLAAIFSSRATLPVETTGNAQSEQPAAAEPASEAPKRRGRPAKTEPVEEKPAEQPAAADEQQTDIEEAIEASKAAEKAAAKPEPAKSDEKVTLDSVRKFVVEQYLHAHFVGQEAQRVAFRALLDEFQTETLSKLPAEKLPEMKARVEALIAEKAAAK